ncbi:hypothetical protein ACFS07_30015 [Undibacterium arcticum]
MQPPTDLTRKDGVRALTRRVANALRPSVDDTEFMRESSAAVMEGPRYFTHWILWLTLLFCALALGVGGAGHGRRIHRRRRQGDSIEPGADRAKPGGRHRLRNPGAGGTGGAKKDQALMRIDDTRFTASSHEGQAKDHALLARIARLTAEAGNTEFVPPAQLEKGKIPS